MSKLTVSKSLSDKADRINELLSRGVKHIGNTPYQKEVVRFLNLSGEDIRLDEWELAKLTYYEKAKIPAEVFVDVILDHRNVLW